MTPAYTDILPFRFLDAAGRERLRDNATETSFLDGSSIIRAHDTEDRRVFLLLEGQVEAVDPDGNRSTVIHAGHYFGERAALFDGPRAFDVRADGPVRVATLPGEVLIALLRDQPAFAHAMGQMLREKQGIFTAFDRFLAALGNGAAQGRIEISDLLALYLPLNPALHPHAQQAPIDFGALGYALARLPDNIGSSLTLLLTEDVPWLYRRCAETFEPVRTRARRRSVYEMMPGKSMVVLRDGMSDLVDLVTCLCIYAVEARKIRHRIRDPDTLHGLARGRVDITALDGFEASEISQLESLFPSLPERLVQLASHHEDVSIHVVKTLDNYNSAHSEQWTAQIAEATAKLTGHDPRELPADWRVHIISSNTHSVGNCLSSWLQQHAAEIEAWGQTALPEVHGLPWTHPMDRVVALTRPWLDAHPDRAAERERAEATDAVHLDHTALTGISVQLFDLAQLAQRTLDPDLPSPASDAPGLLINIDYAFGQQAEAIIGALIVLFGHRIRSVNILGKAGGLDGERGDVFVATHFIEQEDDVLHVPEIDVDLVRLRARIPDRSVRVGPVLTVLGTVMQNQVMLNFYRRLWGCVGLEMEGSYYCRQLLQSKTRGVLRADVALRFLYYVSDLPLHEGQNLSGSMRALEGIPPLYAVTREVLAAILTPSRAS